MEAEAAERAEQEAEENACREREEAESAELAAREADENSLCEQEEAKSSIAPFEGLIERRTEGQDQIEESESGSDEEETKDQS